MGCITTAQDRAMNHNDMIDGMVAKTITEMSKRLAHLDGDALKERLEWCANEYRTCFLVSREAYATTALACVDIANDNGCQEDAAFFRWLAEDALHAYAGPRVLLEAARSMLRSS